MKKCWIKLRPYVEYESRQRQEPYHYGSVRQLAEHGISDRIAPSGLLPDVG